MRVRDLQQILKTPDYDPLIVTRPDTPTPIWMLGTSTSSASLAAQFGLPYNFALFINGCDPSSAYDLYRNNFQPSEQLAFPYASIAVNIFCADTEEEAIQLSKSRSLLFLRLQKEGKYSKLPYIKEAEKYDYTEKDLAFIERSNRHNIIGNPEQVKAQLLAMQKRYKLDEIMAVTPTYDFKPRKHSVKLISEVMKLS